ncbi:helix-turn-helix transcriptional regulator [Haloarcula amylovorans]|uniref:helix-turn-helix transcriptional regulator n=1 Tax=Haloarcula amylovorans TaxID=2562280 RepID=UPI001FD8354C|nr:helix-turn-helix transcriptional regulator [Halomicroarcula amylolytica]
MTKDADNTDNDSGIEDEQNHDARTRLASGLRALADEVERADRQLGHNNLDVDITDGIATIVTTYDLRERYDIGEDPEGYTEPEVMTDGGGVQERTAGAADDGEFTRFKWDILYMLAAEHDEADYGLGLKASLEAYYDEEVNHGRLYPNLDELVKQGCVEKSKLDDRTNEYTLTEKGAELIREDAKRRQTIASNLGGEL